MAPVIATIGPFNVYAFGFFLAVLFLSIKTLWDISKRLENKYAFKASHLESGFIKYLKFPKVSVPSTLLNNLALQAPLFLISFFFSNSDAGQFSLSNMLLRVPLSLIGISIGKVFYQRAAIAKKENNLDSLVYRTFEKLLLLSIIPSIFLMFFGKDFILLFFGNQWDLAGIITQILAPWILFVFISSPISTLINITERQEIGLYFNVLLLLSRFLSLVQHQRVSQPFF